MLRFNHMEITVPPGTLARDGEALSAFMLELYGFAAQPFPADLPLPGIAYSLDPDGEQFLFIAEHQQPLNRASDDHLGFHFDTAAEVDAIVARATVWQARDPRVEIRDFGLQDFGRWDTRAAYIRFILPIWFDVQNVFSKEPKSASWEYVRASC